MKKQHKKPTKERVKSYSWRNFSRVFGVEHYSALAIPECYSFVVNEKVLRASKRYKANPPYHEKLTKKYGFSLSRGYRGPAVIRFVSKAVGHGLFATRSINKGDLIGEYTGRLMLAREAEADNYYLFEYPGSYEMPSGKKVRFCVDAHLQGNFIRFINHSPIAPNVEVLEVPYKGRWYIAYVACEDISPGEQLLVDYGKNYWSDKKSPAKLKP